jgi:LPPG:FO 2-phospho-L-lactate transferase
MLRTRMLKKGEPLSTVTQKLAGGLGVGVRLIPATDDWLRTKIQTPDGELDFQEWFVRHRHADRVDGVRFEGAEASRPAPGVVEAIAEADVVVIAPSNPFVSIRPIVAVPGIEEVLREKGVAAISPLVGGKAVRGPLAEMMASLGHEPSAAGVRALYGDLISTFVIDREDAALADAIPGAVVCDTVMVLPERRAEVGRGLLEAIG